jgi:hypothetical protein
LKKKESQLEHSISKVVRDMKYVKNIAESISNFQGDVFDFFFCMASFTDNGRPVRELPSMHSRKSNPNPKFLGTAEAYFVCHISPNFQIFLICAFIGCP